MKKLAILLSTVLPLFFWGYAGQDTGTRGLIVKAAAPTASASTVQEW
jgi:hypothetical protein